MYTVTPDENFIIDYVPGSDKVVIASACSGHGFKHSAATGEMAAQLAYKGAADLDSSLFSFNRFITN
jgi:sarcosine oxidase